MNYTINRFIYMRLPGDPQSHLINQAKLNRSVMTNQSMLISIAQ